MPLMMLCVGQTARISEMMCNGANRIRLAEFGLKIGSVVRVVSRNSGGLVVALKESRLVIQSGMAHQIRVEI